MNYSDYKPLYLGFGSNLGDSAHLITLAIRRVAENNHITFVKQSSLWRTQALYDANQPDFTNAVAKYMSDLKPEEILDQTRLIEKQFMRLRDAKRPKGPRTLDIDILFYGDLIVKSRDVIIPHPYFHERNFVLFPMAEIDVHYKVAGTKRCIGEWKERCPDTSYV